jgi:Type I phosphodiesterase / nucleotide pyrophosphatase
MGRGQPSITVRPGACLLVLTLLATGATISGQPSRESSKAGTSLTRNAATVAARARFLGMFARAQFPGRSGDLLIVPREGHFITRPEADVTFMHGSPWSYDVSIPLMFAGPAVKPGVYSIPAAQQDVAPTLAAALSQSMPPTATGRVLPVLRPGFARPRAVFLLVLDGMRRDYFDRYAAQMPTLSAIRRNAAWFSQAQINVLPTNTAVGHATISTGADPRIHGITVNNIIDRVNRRRTDLFSGMNPQVLMALTLADVWQLATSGRAVVLAQGSVYRASTPLAGRGACQPNGAPVVLVSYDETTGAWTSNPDCYRLPDYLKGRNASTLWAAKPDWLNHKIDSPGAIRRSALFPAFEADAMTDMIEREPIGEDDVPDLILMNYKTPDYVGHQYGPDSKELGLTLGELDRNLARMIGALEAKVGKDYLLAVTADHGMPSAPPDHRHFAPAVVDAVHQKFDPQSKQIVIAYESENAQMFVDQSRLAQLGLTLADLARFIESQPYMFAVFTHDEVRRAASAKPVTAAGKS